MDDGEAAEMRERAFSFVRQELKRGVGVALVTMLLQSTQTYVGPVQEFRSVSWALLVVDEMVLGKRESNPSEGVLLLNRLVSAIGTPASPANGGEKNYAPSLAFFDGSLLVAASEKLGVVTRTIGKVKVDRVRQLSEPELLHHWETLVATWTNGANLSLLDPSFELSVRSVPRIHDTNLT